MDHFQGIGMKFKRFFSKYFLSKYVISIHKLCPQPLLKHSVDHFQGINFFCQNMLKNDISIHKLCPQPVLKHSVDHFQGMGMKFKRFFFRKKCHFFKFEHVLQWDFELRICASMFLHLCCDMPPCILDPPVGSLCWICCPNLTYYLTSFLTFCLIKR